MSQRLQKDAAIYSELVSIIERDSDAVYDILEVLISNLNDKQLETSALKQFKFIH